MTKHHGSKCNLEGLFKLCFFLALFFITCINTMHSIPSRHPTITTILTLGTNWNIFLSVRQAGEEIKLSQYQFVLVHTKNVLKIFFVQFLK